MKPPSLNERSRRKAWLAATAAMPAVLLLCQQQAAALNIAPEGTATFGFNNAVDGDAGEFYVHSGQSVSRLNDSNFTVAIDNWKGDAGGDGGQDISFAGILWNAARPESVTGLKATFATYGDGGWFGPARLAGLSPGGVLTAAYLTEPSVQITTDGGITWTTAASSSNYVSAMTGHQIGGGTNPMNPSSKTVTFTLTSPVTNIDGIRIIGENGGTSDGGFLGMFELEVEATLADGDNDGMDDEWEDMNGLDRTVNDAGIDLEPDGLTNLQEFQLQTNPQVADTDGDGLNDGAEVNTHQTDPRLADTDGDGLSDGAEILIHLTNPKVADTDGDGLTDGAEINTWFTNPLVQDSDGDGYADAVEVRLFSNPANADSVPANIAPSGTAIIGTSTALEGGVDTPYSQQGTPGVINDALLSTRLDTFGRNDPYAYVGITWPAARTVAVDRLELMQALFRDGGWFGPNNVSPAFGGTLDASLHLTAPSVQVTTDGTTWTTVDSSSSYVPLMDGAAIPDLGAIPLVRSKFQLAVPQAGIMGIRLIGPEGGIASGGFIGVWELGVGDVSTSVNPNIALLGTARMGTSTDPGDTATDTAYTQQGAPQNINDGQLSTSTDTFNRSDPYAYAGIIWPAPRAAAVDRIEANFAIYGDGGWFGPNGSFPVGGALVHPADSPMLEEPQVQVTTDGGGTWTTVPHSSTYLTAMNAFPVPGGLSPSVVFALTPPVAGINGIRLIGHEGGTASGGFIGLHEFAVKEVPAVTPTNIALSATAVTGLNDATDTDFGRPFMASGHFRNINDGNPATRVDTFDGAGGVDAVSYASLFWPPGKSASIESLTLNMATFSDGGWFGPSLESPAPGGALSSPQYLTAPEIQILAASGDWQTVTATTDYLTVFNGHTIGGGGNPNPSSPAPASFAFSPPLNGVRGIRVIGNAGGTSSGGFIGVFELAATGSQASGSDSDGDGQSDDAEAIAGTDPNDPRSVLTITNVNLAANNLNVTWSSVPGRTYQLQRTTDVSTGVWSNVGTAVVGPASPATTLSTSAPLGGTPPNRLFLRVLVTR